MRVEPEKEAKSITHEPLEFANNSEYIQKRQKSLKKQKNIKNVSQLKNILGLGVDKEIYAKRNLEIQQANYQHEPRF